MLLPLGRGGGQILASSFSFFVLLLDCDSVLITADEVLVSLCCYGEITGNEIDDNDEEEGCFSFFVLLL